MKIYLGGAMFTEPEVIYNLAIAKRLRACGFIVYCPNENLSINDKTRTDITPQKVYKADIEELESCNVFICQVTEDSGTMWEAGFMDCLSKKINPSFYLGCIGLATDIRLLATPNPTQTGVDNLAFAINAFIIGGLKLSLGVYLNIDEMILKLHELKAKFDE